MTSKMRSIIFDAGYTVCQTCYGDGTDSMEKSKKAQSSFEYASIGACLIGSCSTCNGDGVVKRDRDRDYTFTFVDVEKNNG
jgi:hypothetical protein